jgi:hypothetical protein
LAYKEESPRRVVLDLGDYELSRTKRAASKSGVGSSTAAAN